jgi:hypothetical protein
LVRAAESISRPALAAPPLDSPPPPQAERKSAKRATLEPRMVNLDECGGSFLLRSPSTTKPTG